MKAVLAKTIVVGLVLWALACDLVRTFWRYAQAHPVQAAGWALGGVVVVIVVCFIISLKIED